MKDFLKGSLKFSLVCLNIASWGVSKATKKLSSTLSTLTEKVDKL